MRISTRRRAGARSALGVLAVCGVAAIGITAAPSLARQDPWLDLQCSYASSEAGFWNDHLVYGPPGTTIFVRVVMHIPETYHGVAGARFNITSNTFEWGLGSDVCDLTTAKGNATDARIPGFDFGSNPQQVFSSGNRLRIDMLDDVNDLPSVGINVAQNTPGQLGTKFNTGKSVTVYKFALTLQTIANTGFLHLRIPDGGNHGSPDQLASFRAYETSTSSIGAEIPGAYGDTAIIFIPAPAASLIAAAAVPLVVRRRQI